MPDFLIIIVEIMIFVCGAGSIILLNLNNKYSKYGAVIGLIGQPFWFISAVRGESWGIVAASVMYSVSYCVGIYSFWLRKNKQRKEKCSH